MERLWRWVLTRQGRSAHFNAGQASRGNERPIRLRQLLLRRVEQPQMRLDVVQETCVPVLFRHSLVEVHKIGHPGPAGIGNHHIQPSELCNGFLDEFLDCRAVSHIRSNGFKAGGFGRCSWDLMELFEESFSPGLVVGVVDYLFDTYLSSNHHRSILMVIQLGSREQEIVRLPRRDQPILR